MRAWARRSRRAWISADWAISVSSAAPPPEVRARSRTCRRAVAADRSDFGDDQLLADVGEDAAGDVVGFGEHQLRAGAGANDVLLETLQPGVELVALRRQGVECLQPAFARRHDLLADEGVADGVGDARRDRRIPGRRGDFGDTGLADLGHRHRLGEGGDGGALRRSHRPHGGRAVADGDVCLRIGVGLAGRLELAVELRVVAEAGGARRLPENVEAGDRLHPALDAHRIDIGVGIAPLFFEHAEAVAVDTHQGGRLELRRQQSGDGEGQAGGDDAGKGDLPPAAADRVEDEGEVERIPLLRPRLQTRLQRPRSAR